MGNVVRGLAILMFALQAACSTAGGMYTENDPVNGDFSVWKTAGAVVLGVLTLGAIGAAAYAGAQDSRPTYTTTYTTPSYNYDGTRTYFINGQMVTCTRSGSFISCI